MSPRTSHAIKVETKGSRSTCPIGAGSGNPLNGYLAFTSWRGIFWTLALCGVAGLIGCLFFFGENLRNPTEGTPLRALTRLAFVIHNKDFLALLLIFSVATMPFMAYLAISSYVYQDFFGLSPQAYSLFFACNAGLGVSGPLLYVRFMHNWPKRILMSPSFIITAVAGVLIIIFGHTGPITFTFLYFLITIAHTAIRPPSTVHDESA